MIATMRSHTQEARKLRYRMARRHPPWTLFFVVVGNGAALRMRAVEWHDIVNHRPSANGYVATGVRDKQRKRPPKHCRVPRPHDLSEHDARLRAREARLTKMDHGSFTQKTYALWIPYAIAYATCARATFADTGLFGPCDIYSPINAHLLALWLVTRLACVDWQLCERKWGNSFLFPALCGLKRFLPRSGQRAMLSRRLREYCDYKRLPFCLLRIASPDKESTRVLRRILVLYINSAARFSLAEKSWLKSRLRVHVGKCRTFKSFWNHVQVAGNASLTSLEGMSEEDLTSIMSGQGFLRSEKNWDVRYRLTFAERVQYIRDETMKGLMKLGLPRRELAGLHSAVSSSLRSSVEVDKLLARQQRSAEAYSRETKGLQFYRLRRAVVPDDKNKKSAWILPKLAYQVLCLAFVCLSSTWTFVKYSRSYANKVLLQRMKDTLGVTLSARLGLRDGVWVLPYVYTTLKSKCFFDGYQVGRCCKKLSHSCVRKICSYAKWPKRRVWQYFNRGADVILRCMCPGFEAHGLKDATAKLREGLRDLDVPGNPYTCLRCQAEKQRFTAIVADAGQFYEEVAPQRALQAGFSVFSAAASAGWKGVAVARTRKFFGFMTCDLQGGRGKFVRLGLPDIFATFSTAISVSLVSVGQAVAMLSGLPIGGLMSKLASSMVLCQEEEAWKASSSRRAQAGFYSLRNSWKRTVCHVRYVDDVFLGTHSFCKGCLVDLLLHVYDERFDVAEDVFPLHFLDMVVGSDKSLTPKRKKLQIPPPWATWGKGGNKGQYNQWSSKNWNRSNWSGGHQQSWGGKGSSSSFDAGMAYAMWMGDRENSARRHSRKKRSHRGDASSGSSRSSSADTHKRSRQASKLKQELSELRAFKEKTEQAAIEEQKHKELKELEQRLWERLQSTGAHAKPAPPAGKTAENVILSGPQKRLAAKVLDGTI
ncbi:SMG1 [Symbiodinium natans]|uniref:SMG1 protein n=1 Tax=Symbiodinium natans TaxID=878477 RepID=A0A812MD10_9DINO|nr:SMG1 [Symbiodinium natans]